MTESDRKNQKQCILTVKGRQKLIIGLEKCYPESYTISDVARDMGGINRRDTVSKIIQKPQENVVYSSLAQFFSLLELDLEDDDWQTNPKSKSTSTSTDRRIDVDFNAVREVLTSLNYRSQVPRFTDYLNELPTGNAFLVHGKARHGQRWLVNLLCREVPCPCPRFEKRFHLTRYRTDIKKLWENIALEIKSPTAKPNDIVKTLYQHWETQVLLLSFHDIDLISSEYLQEFMSQLWNPLAAKLEASGNVDEHPCLLFLVDNQQYHAQGKLDFSQDDKNLIILEELQPFSKKELRRWLILERTKKLFSSIRTNSIEDIMNDILAQNETPESALTAICSWFYLDWDSEISGRLSL